MNHSQVYRSDNSFIKEIHIRKIHRCGSQISHLKHFFLIANFIKASNLERINTNDKQASPAKKQQQKGIKTP